MKRLALLFTVLLIISFFLIDDIIAQFITHNDVVNIDDKAELPAYSDTREPDPSSTLIDNDSASTDPTSQPSYDTTSINSELLASLIEESMTNPEVVSPAFEGSTCLNIDVNTGMPESNITSFVSTDRVIVAGRLTGITDKTNLIFQWEFPNGTTNEDKLYNLENDRTINMGYYAENMGSGNGSVSVILETTNETLATYNYTIDAPSAPPAKEPVYTEETTPAPATTPEEPNEVDIGLAERYVINDFPSLESISGGSGVTDLDGIQ